MGTTKIVNVDPTGAAREITDIDVTVGYGETVEVSTELADRLLEQPAIWARPTSKAAKESAGGPKPPPPAEPVKQP